MMKNKTVKIMALVAAIVLIVGIVMVLVYPKKSIAFEKYFTSEQSDFLMKEKNSYAISKEEMIENYKRPATFLHHEGEAVFTRSKDNHTFVKNRFQMKLKENKEEDKVREEGEALLEEIKSYLNYDGPVEINTTLKDGVDPVDPTKWMFRSLLDDEVTIYYSFYVDQKIFEYSLTKEDQTIYAAIQYQGLLGK